MWQAIKATMDDAEESDWRPAWKRAAATKILARPESVVPLATFLFQTAIGARQRPTPPLSPTPSQEPVAEEATDDRWRIDEEEIGAIVRRYMGWEELADR